MRDFDYVTTEAAVKTYKSAIGVFSALLREVRELSKKKPDAALSASKVKMINKPLNDLLAILEGEPEGKYLQVLEDEFPLQVSDALMMMVQFDAALKGFEGRYYQFVSGGPLSDGEKHWITDEFKKLWKDGEAELEANDDEDCV